MSEPCKSYNDRYLPHGPDSLCPIREPSKAAIALWITTPLIVVIAIIVSLLFCGCTDAQLLADFLNHGIKTGE